MDENRDSHSIRLKVFRDEAPDLFARLEQLPSGKYTKRTALIRILELGFQAAVGDLGLQRVQARPVESASPRAPAVGAPIVVPDEDQMPDVKIDDADLVTLFG